MTNIRISSVKHTATPKTIQKRQASHPTCLAQNFIRNGSLRTAGITDVKQINARTKLGYSLPIAIDSEGKTMELIELAKRHQMEIMFAGGTARRMLLGENPIDVTGDIDLVVTNITVIGFGNKQSRIESFKRAAADLLGGIKVEIINTMFDPDIMMDDADILGPYENVKGTSTWSVNRLLVRPPKNEAGEWMVEDDQGGKWVNEIKNGRAEIVPAVDPDGKINVKLDFEVALRLIRTLVESPRIDVKNYRGIINGVLAKMTGKEIIECLKWQAEHINRTAKPQMTREELRHVFYWAKMLEHIFKVFIHADQPDQVKGLLSSFRAGKRSLLKVIESTIDVDKVINIIKEVRMRREPISVEAFILRYYGLKVEIVEPKKDYYYWD